MWKSCIMDSFLFLMLSWFLQLVASNPLSAYQALGKTTPYLPPNTNHIFNAIHSSMRQWGSSINHNGMSFFLATVPKELQFYHGTHMSKPVTGMEWLAFEPEHAMLFAGGRGPPRRRPGEPREPGQPPDEPGRRPPPDSPGRGPPPPMAFGYHQHVTEQVPMAGEDEEGTNMTSGWLHTYATKRDLQLLYIDGMSAAKSDKGTLDSQDHVLLNDTEPHIGFYDYTRATLMCKLAKDRWSNRIDGFIRMEAGFEIILCSFEQNLDSVRITRAKDRDGNGEPGRRIGWDARFAYYRAIAARYHDIGGGRVALDYDHFVTAYTYPIDLFASGEELPRLRNLSAKAVAPLVTDLDSLVVGKNVNKSSYNWQSIADMIVERYAKTLKYLISGALSTTELLQEEIGLLLQPFIDWEFPDVTAEIERCASQFLPPVHNSSLAARVITDVSTLICSTLRSSLDEDDHETAVSSIQALIEYLDWTTWKDCGGCGVDEICFTAIWPQGSVEDREHPSCTNASALQEKHGYWGGFGPRH